MYTEPVRDDPCARAILYRPRLRLRCDKTHTGSVSTSSRTTIVA